MTLGRVEKNAPTNSNIPCQEHPPVMLGLYCTHATKSMLQTQTSTLTLTAIKDEQKSYNRRGRNQTLEVLLVKHEKIRRTKTSPAFSFEYDLKHVSNGLALDMIY